MDDYNAEWERLADLDDEGASYEEGRVLFDRMMAADLPGSPVKQFPAYAEWLKRHLSRIDAELIGKR